MSMYDPQVSNLAYECPRHNLIVDSKKVLRQHTIRDAKRQDQRKSSILFCFIIHWSGGRYSLSATVEQEIDTWV